MKHLAIVATLLTAGLWAQTAPGAPVSAPSPAFTLSDSQRYCAGFVRRQPVPRTNFVVGTPELPQESRGHGGQLLFVGGPALKAGERYSILRRVVDPNQQESSPEQRKRLGSLGALWAEVGWGTARQGRDGGSLVSFDFSCDTVVRGDLVVPFEEKPAINPRQAPPTLPLFVDQPHAVQGRILGARDFVGLLGTGTAVYTDFGSARGVRPGDYLIIFRGYAEENLNLSDKPNDELPKLAEPSALNTARIKSGAERRLPPRVVGELLVLTATPEASTAIIVRSFSEIQLGDAIQNEAEGADVPPPPTCSTLSRLRHKVRLGGCKVQ